METTCPASIAAAIRNCDACPATPPSRGLVLMDRVSESRAQPGMMVQVNTSGPLPRDSRGRIAHVRGLLIVASASISVPNLTGKLDAPDVRSVYQAIRLEDTTGHVYLPDLDGRDLLDDVYFRHGVRRDLLALQTGTEAGSWKPSITVSNGISANATGVTVLTQVDASLYFPLTTDRPGADPLAGLIPLVALQRRGGNGSFRFKLSTSFPAYGAAAAQPTVTGFENGEGFAGLDVYFDIVWLPALAVGPTWQLDSYTLPDTSGSYNEPDAGTEYLAMRYRIEDAPNGQVVSGPTAVGNVGTWTVDVGGETVLPGMSLSDMKIRQQFFAASDMESATSTATAKQDLPLWANGSEILPDAGQMTANAMVILPYRQRGSGEASGRIGYKYASVSGDFFRYLQRTVDCNEAKRVAAFAAAVGCDPCAKATMLDNTGNPVQGGTARGTVLVVDPRRGI